MKLQDLVETKKIIKTDVLIPANATELNYKGVTVRGNFNCAHTGITSLKGAPKWVGGDFECYNTKITSFEGAPKVIHGNVVAMNTKMTSLHNIHKQVDFIFRRLYISNTVESHILGVMFIKGLKEIEFHGGDHKQHEVENIVNKYLPGGDVHACQEELIEAGFAEYAKL